MECAAPTSYLAKFFDKTKDMTPTQIAEFLEGDDEVSEQVATLVISTSAATTFSLCGAECDS